jgi:hypothetical protein
MSRFLKAFLRDPPDARIHFAAFGKHPAWDDHIDDIGLGTETLALTKQGLYSEGIATQLASGAWNQIENSGTAIDFDHRFVWGRDQQAVVGAIWASTDRKGRARFPLVICAQSGFEGPRAVDLLFEPLERLGALCRNANTQEAVRDAFSTMQAGLNYAVPPPIDGSLFSGIAESSENTILPAMVTLSAGLKNNRQRGSRETAKTSGCHFRLTAISAQPKENLIFWSAYLGSQRTSSGPPYIVIAMNGKSWVDIIVGEPLQNDFFCLRANEYALPSTWIDIDGPERSKLEAAAKNYLLTYRLGPAASSGHPRSWWSGLFKK